MDFIRALEGWGVPVAILMVIAGIVVLGLVVEAITKIFGKRVPVLKFIAWPFKKWNESRRKKAKLFEDLQASLNQLNNRGCQEEQKSVCEENDKKLDDSELRVFLEELRAHYTTENIADRDRWMLDVNTTMNWCREKAKGYDASVQELKELTKVVKEQQNALELNNKMTSELYKQATRTQILDFSHKLVNARKAEKPVIFSREEFRKIRKSYKAYEVFLENYGGTNGEVDDAMEIIKDAEAGKLPNIEFLEDLRD